MCLLERIFIEAYDVPGTALDAEYSRKQSRKSFHHAVHILMGETDKTEK